MMLTLPKPRTVNKDGISYHNVKFQAPQLANFRGARSTCGFFPTCTTASPLA